MPNPDNLRFDSEHQRSAGKKSWSTRQGDPVAKIAHMRATGRGLLLAADRLEAEFNARTGEDSDDDA